MSHKYCLSLRPICEYVNIPYFLYIECQDNHIQSLYHTQNNASSADDINSELSSLCDDGLSDTMRGYITIGILIIVVLKMLLIIIGICYKLCRHELRPENEYLRNLLKPLYIPSLCSTQKDLKRKQTQALLHRLERIDSTPQSRLQRRTEKSETIDMYGAKSYYVYYRMEDQRKNRNICCKFLYCIYYAFMYLGIFILWLCYLTKWLFVTSLWMITLILNFILSIQLFFIHHSPILGADNMDFCSDHDNQNACTIGQDTCGIINWIILPDVSKYLVPRYITLTIAC